MKNYIISILGFKLWIVKSETFTFKPDMRFRAKTINFLNIGISINQKAIKCGLDNGFIKL